MDGETQPLSLMSPGGRECGGSEPSGQKGGWGAGGVGGRDQGAAAGGSRPGCRAVTGREAGGYAGSVCSVCRAQGACAPSRCGLVCCAEAAFHRAAKCYDVYGMEGDGGRARRVHSG
eukprot:4822091-Prymnesium_polylepis.1